MAMKSKPGFFSWRDYILFVMRAAGMDQATAEKTLKEYRNEVLREAEGH
jgi:hypothetical protein